MLIMKKLLITLCIFMFATVGICLAEGNAGLRDYDGILVPKGTFIPVISAQEISTVYGDVGTQVKFISTTDLFLYDTNIIPQNTEFYGYIEKINEPVVGTNASMIIKITKLKFVDDFEIPVRGYIYTNNGNLIGGELTEPAKYIKKASYMQGNPSMVGWVPGETRKMGENRVIASGADLIIILTSPLQITHTVTN